MGQLPGEPLPGDSSDQVGDRDRLLQIGMAAVFAACVVFAVARLAVTVRTGLLTPWWANAAGALALAGLYLWYRRAPRFRSSAAVHGTAVVACIALMVPLAYGMVSTVWWLSLVGFAVVLMGRRREAWTWGIATVALTVVAVLVEPQVQVAGETPLEGALARILFVVLLVTMAAAFRRVANDRAEELSALARSLKRANAARTRFLTHVSHDVRTPLHGVVAMLERALDGELPPATREDLESADGSARLLVHLLNNVLDLTRAESDAVALQRQPFELDAVVARALVPLAREAASKHLRLTATLEPGTNTRRIGDPFRLSQLLVNLVGNAVKFTGQGAVEVRIRPLPPDQLEIEVADTGAGIPREQHEAIFEPFVQVVPASGAPRVGSGLGLAIVREVVRAMRGRLALDSEPGRGARFTLRLPLPADPDQPPRSVPPDLLAGAAAELHPATVPLHRALRVLVCDDDHVSRQVAEHMLRDLGHAPEVVDSAEAVLTRLESVPFDLLVTDIELPGIDGATLTRTLRAGETRGERPRLPILASTAHVGEDEHRELLAAGFDGVLTKPFDRARLAAAIAPW